MAVAPHLKVFDSQGKYVASFKYEEDAASFITLLGDGASIRLGHRKANTLWNEGAEDQPAAESYDHAAEVMRKRQYE